MIIAHGNNIVFQNQYLNERNLLIFLQNAQNQLVLKELQLIRIDHVILRNLPEIVFNRKNEHSQTKRVLLNIESLRETETSAISRAIDSPEQDRLRQRYQRPERLVPQTIFVEYELETVDVRQAEYPALEGTHDLHFGADQVLQIPFLAQNVVCLFERDRVFVVDFAADVPTQDAQFKQIVGPAS